ncbi:MAG: hypothetical protein KC613_14885, partial [Myxococcales bacterium]|nr:hypothetical protein [Myxococcales bacterium]
LSLGLGLSGCFRTATFTSAQPLEAGRHELAVRGNALGILSGTDGGAVAVGALRYRVGLDGTQDLGLSLGTDGAYLQYKRALVGGTTRLSLAPEVGGFFLGDDYTQFSAQVPLLVGWAVGGSHELTLAPRLGVVVGGDFDGRGDDFGVMPVAALSFGGTFRLGRTVRLVPEVALNYPVVALRDDVSWNHDFLVVEAGLALAFEFGGSD